MKPALPLFLALAVLSTPAFAQSPATTQDAPIPTLPEVSTTASPYAPETDTAEAPPSTPDAVTPLEATASASDEVRADEADATQPADAPRTSGDADADADTVTDNDSVRDDGDPPLSRAEVDRLPVRALWNIPYAGLREARHRLDLYLPREPSVFPLPVIVFFHGGDWVAGDKRDAARRLLPFVLSGRYAVVSANYRLADDARWPAQIEDAKAVIRWIRAGERRYGFDPERIGVWGEDAGAQLAMLLGTTGDIAAVEGDFGRLAPNSRVQAVVSFSGTSDVPGLLIQPGRIDHDMPDSPSSRLLGQPPSQLADAARQASPLHWVTADDAPTLHVHGTLDRIVTMAQPEAMDAALRAVGVESVLVPVLNARHDGFGAVADEHARVFFERHLHDKPLALPSDEILDLQPQ